MKIRLLMLMILAVSALSILSGAAAQEENVPCPPNAFIEPDTESGLVLEIRCTEDTIIIATNNLPNFETGDFPDGEVSISPRTWYVPIEPEMADTPIDLPRLGAVAISVNGLQIHGPNGADFDNYFDPVHEGIVDHCHGHIAQGTYHFHASPDCLFEQLVEDVEDPAQLVGVVLGYAFDGYPILSPFLCANEDCTEVTELTSSWQRTSDVTNAWEANEYVEGSGDLDRCNGMVLEDGSYAYFATQSFPYFMGCYTGIPEELNFDPEATRYSGSQPPGQGQGGQPPQGGGPGQPPPPPPGN